MAQRYDRREEDLAAAWTQASPGWRANGPRASVLDDPQISGRSAELDTETPAYEIEGHNLWSGSPACLRVPAHARPSLIEEALDRVHQLAPMLSPQGCRPLELTADPTIHRTPSGGRVVHLHQHCRGVPVFEAVRTVCFDAAGRLLDIVGDNLPIPDGIELEPELTAAEAAALAARHVSQGWASKRPTKAAARVISTFPSAARQTVLRKNRIPGKIDAYLCLFGGLGEPVLCWRVAIAAKLVEDEHQLMIGARGRYLGEILYCCHTHHCVAARGLVYREPPSTGGVAREMLDFPRPLSELPPSANPRLPVDWTPGDWVAGKRTKGNNCAVVGPGGFKGKKSSGVVVFTPSNPSGRKQMALNAFYLCNYLHDFFYLLGFDDHEQCFQKENSGNVAGGGDEVEIEVFKESQGDVANFRSRPDGESPEMRLGAWGPDKRLSALDPDVVIHEYAHGVVNRLLAGRLVFEMPGHPQSLAFGEGLSDYFALTIQSYHRLPGPEKTVFGAWISGNARSGLRQDPYDAEFPGHFGVLGGALDGASTPDGAPRFYVEEHDAGEIWCAAMLRLNRELGALLGDLAKGHELGWSLVMGALKRTPAVPSFLLARDALFREQEARVVDGLDSALRGEEIREVMLRVFLRIGMGPEAVSPSAGYTGLVADFGT